MERLGKGAACALRDMQAWFARGCCRAMVLFELSHFDFHFFKSTGR